MTKAIPVNLTYPWKKTFSDCSVELSVFTNSFDKKSRKNNLEEEKNKEIKHIGRCNRITAELERKSPT